MTGQTIILSTPRQRAMARRLIDLAPDRAVVNIREERRTNAQNDLMWSLLSDLSRAKPEGRTHTPDMWKALCMAACGHEVQFLMGLDGNPFPVGFRSSRLSKAQMSELIEFIFAWGSERGVRWSNEPQEEAA